MQSRLEKRKVILLFGLPRSGTTWIGKIFDSHPDVLYRHEPDSVQRLTLPMLTAALNDEQSDELEQFVSKACNSSAIKVVGKQPILAKSYLSQLQLALYRMGVFAARGLGSLGIDNPVMFTPHPRDAVLVWKSIESLGRIGPLKTALDAHAIHIIRHPCGYVNSVIRGERLNRFDGSEASSEDFNLLEQLLQTNYAKVCNLDLQHLRELTPEERLAWRWVLFNTKAMEDSKSADIHPLIYEQICTDPVEEAKKMFAAVDLTWREETEKFLQTSTGDSNKDDYYSVFKIPLVSAYKWREELSTAQQDLILRVVEGTPPARYVVEAVEDFSDRDN